MKKINICYLISSLANEGPTRVLLNIIKYLDKNIYNIFIYTINSEKDNTLLDQFKLQDVKLLLANGANYSSFRKLRLIQNAVKENDIDIIHSHCPRSLIYMFFLRKMSRTCYTAHIYPGVQTIALYGKFKGEIIKFLSNYLIKKIDMPIACSESVAEEFKNGISFAMAAVNNGIEDPIPNMSSALREKFREQLGFSAEKIYVLFVGRLSPEKNPYNLAKAFKTLPSDKYSLVMIGDGPEAEKIKVIATPSTRLDGFQKNIIPYLCAADIYISPSKTEGLANSLLEAMAAGMPLLLSDIPSHRYIISCSKQYIGEIFDSDDFSDLQEKIHSIENGMNFENKKSIRIEFMKKYTAKSMADGYSAKYMELINGK